MTVTVPSQYSQYINAAAAGTGLPASVVAAQALQESGANPNTPDSPTGAKGFWQFEPYTYNQYAGQAGVPQNSWYNLGDETQVYIVYMNQLLKQEGGNVFAALEAYNAGPGNLNAGSGYANTIMQNAGQPNTLNVSSAQTASIWNSILGLPSGGISGLIGSGISSAIGDLGSQFLKWIGVPDLKDLLQRLALIVFGAILVIVGMAMLAKGPVMSATQTAEKVAPEAAVL